MDSLPTLLIGTNIWSNETLFYRHESISKDLLAVDKTKGEKKDLPITGIDWLIRDLLSQPHWIKWLS